MKDNTAKTLAICILAAALVAVVYILYKKSLADNETQKAQIEAQRQIAEMQNNPSDRTFALGLTQNIGNALSGLGGIL